jgi:hypothetical protein
VGFVVDKAHWSRFSPSISVSTANSHSTDCSTFIINYHPGWYDTPISGVGTKWTQSHPTPRPPPPKKKLTRFTEYSFFCVRSGPTRKSRVIESIPRRLTPPLAKQHEGASQLSFVLWPNNVTRLSEWVVKLHRRSHIHTSPCVHIIRSPREVKT